MADKKKKRSKASKSKGSKTSNPSNKKGDGQRVKNRPIDKLFISDQGGLPDSLYRFRDPGANINLQPLQNEIAQIRNYMQQQDARMQIDIPSDLVRSSQLDNAIKKLSTDLQSKLTPPKADVVMKPPTKSTGTGTEPITKSTKDQATQKFKALTKSKGIDPIPELSSFSKPKTTDFIQQTSEATIDLTVAQSQVPDKYRTTRQQKRTAQNRLDEDNNAVQQNLLQREKQVEFERQKLLDSFQKVLNQRNENPIVNNYNIQNTTNYQFEALQINQYLQKNNYEQNVAMLPPNRFTDLGVVNELPPAGIAGFLGDAQTPYQKLANAPPLINQ